MHNTPTFNAAVDAPYFEHAAYNWSTDSIRYINTVSIHTRLHYLYMQECGHFKTPSSYYTERNGLPSYLILFTISGCGRLLLDGNTYLLEPGSCFYIDCKKAHRYEGVGSQTWEFLWIHFYGGSSDGYYEEFSRQFPPVIMLQEPFLLEVTLRRILAIHQKKAVYAEILTASLITSILTELFIQKLSDDMTAVSMPETISQAASYIQNHFAEPITLDLLAEKAAMSKFYLSREFTRFMGTSVNQYLINCRIGYAKELLRESSLPVSEIAFCTGMNHVSQFIRLFRDREGVTPLAYRRLWQDRH